MIEAELAGIRVSTTEVLPETLRLLFKYLGGSPLLILVEYSKIGELLFIKIKSFHSGSSIPIFPIPAGSSETGPIYKTFPESSRLFEYAQGSELLKVEIILLSKFPATAFVAAGYSPSSVI